MPLQATSGAASYDAFGGGVAAVPNYIEDVFSTWLYTGNGNGSTGSQSINNGIDLAGKGGLVWFKARNSATWHNLADTSRGLNKWIYTNDTSGQLTGSSNSLTAFNSNGFSLGADSDGVVNYLNNTYASWTFRKQPKFFDVVTYTGNDTSRSISHNLGSIPGCIIVKNISQSGFNWVVYHRSTGATQWLKLNLTDAVATNATYFPTDPTSTTFAIGSGGLVNNGGDTFVAYLFAHDAGGFGLTGTDNVISCGSFTTDGSGNATVNLGYEPQWTLIKRSDSSTGGNWRINDNMRNMVAAPNLGDQLFPNLSSAESIGNGVAQPTSTGFTTNNGALNASATYIYIAIRRGPMKTPTTGTSVFNLLSAPANGSSSISVGLPYSYSGPDLLLSKTRESPSQSAFVDRLRGAIPADNTTNVPVLRSESTAAEVSATSNAYRTIFGSTQYLEVAGTTTQSAVGYFFRRAPGFFDVCCYTGTGSARTVNHNLAAVPELMIVKNRTVVTQEWTVYSSALGATKYVELTTTASAVTSSTVWGNTEPTASQFTVSTASRVNHNTATYVAYLFASCPGVSKVGSYTGNGSSQTINCGFTGGSRFVMVKRTDSTGNWMVVDTRRGLVAASDPTLYLNSTAAEVTGVDWLDPDSSGFIVNQESTMNANVNGATYIYLAIA